MEKAFHGPWLFKGCFFWIDGVLLLDVVVEKIFMWFLSYFRNKVLLKKLGNACEVFVMNVIEGIIALGNLQ